MKLFKRKFAQGPLFLTFELSFRFFTTLEHHEFFSSSNLVKLDLDLDPAPHSKKLLDPDPHKMNADPQQ